MSNKIRVRKKLAEIKRKNFLKKYRVRYYKRYKIGFVFDFPKEIINPEEKRGNENFWWDGTPYVPTKRPK